MTIHLVDGTYELYRHFYGVPSAKNHDGEEVAAVRGVMYSIRGLVRDGATHIGVATDHVIESFRNDLWPGYKTGEGIDPALWAQFPLLEDGLRAWGLTVWPMVDVEADDALASAAEKAAQDPRVDQVIICSPDKDLAQCVRGTRVVQRDRVRKTTRDEAGVVARFGVLPTSIPDYLALVGDSSDGFPGLPGWGPKSTATVLAKFGHLDAIPEDHLAWGVVIARAGALAATLTRAASWHCSSGISPRCERTCPCSSRLTNSNGAVPHPRSPPSVVGFGSTTELTGEHDGGGQIEPPPHLSIRQVMLWRGTRSTAEHDDRDPASAAVDTGQC